MALSGISVEGPQHHARAQWVAAASLFITSAALLAVRSMPGSLTGEALSVLSWSVTISFAPSCATTYSSGTVTIVRTARSSPRSTRVMRAAR